MSFAPLLRASPVIVVHAFAAMGAFVLGGVQLLAPKGTLSHRTLGYIWAGLLGFVAASSFWIHTIREIGGFSWIHLLSITTLVTLPLGIWRARRHQVGRHARAMTLLFVGALVIAGAFTLYPGRIMYRVVFGL